MSGPWEKYGAAAEPAAAGEAGPWAKFKQNPLPDHPVMPPKRKVMQYDPTDGMSGFDRFVAGYGSAFPRMYRGGKQALGFMSQDEIDETNRLDEPLLSTGAGGAGNIAGTVAPALPAMMVPGANGVVGSGAVGGVTSFLQPTAEGESRTANTLIGTGLGMAGPMMFGTGRVLASTTRGLAEPLYATGQKRIAGRLIDEFASDPAAVRNALSGRTATGAELTLAESAGDGGIARLQDAMRAQNPFFGNQLEARLSANNAARVATLERLAGVDGGKASAEATRSANALQNYGRAYQAPFQASSLTPAQAAEMQSLMQAPAVKQAMEQARINAGNSGRAFSQDGSIEGLHQMKLAMDDQISALMGGSAAEANKAAGIKSAQQRLVNLIEEVSPDYKTARQAYAADSRPINEMDIMGRVLRRGTSNESDMATGAARLQPNALLGALRDEQALVRQATGRNLGGLTETVDPANLNLLRTVAAEADRSAGVRAAGNGPGSATVSRLGTQNALNAFVRSSGLPAGVADSTIAQTALKPLNLLYGGISQPKIEAEVGKALLDPAYAKQLVLLAEQGQIQLPTNIIFQLSGVAAKATPAAAYSASHR